MNLHPEIVKNMEQSEREGGVWLKDWPDEVPLLVETKNRVYRIIKHDKTTTIQGHPKYCLEPTEVSIHGSTWGGSLLKVGFIGVGMHMEFSTSKHRCVTTSKIKSVTAEGEIA